MANIRLSDIALAAVTGGADVRVRTIHSPAHGPLIELDFTVERDGGQVQILANVNPRLWRMALTNALEVTR